MEPRRTQLLEAASEKLLSAESAVRGGDPWEGTAAGGGECGVQMCLGESEPPLAPGDVLGPESMFCAKQSTIASLIFTAPLALLSPTAICRWSPLPVALWTASRSVAAAVALNELPPVIGRACKRGDCGHDGECAGFARGGAC